MKNINGYLTFGGHCREAMAFYQATFGGELSLMTVGESPMAEQWSRDAQSDILHARLTVGGLTLMASDGGRMAPEIAGGASPLPHVSLSLDCEDTAEIERLYAALSEGGKVTCPLGEQFWGATFGALTDRYGINWLLNCEKV